MLAVAEAQHPGDAIGEILFDNNDLDEGRFEITLAAQIGVQVVDNNDAGFQLNASASNFRNDVDPRYLGGDYHYHAGGTGTNSRGLACTRRTACHLTRALMTLLTFAGSRPMAWAAR